MSERYSLRQLEDIISPIARRFGVEKVSVFGSYSRGEADDQSDVDLLIEKGGLRSLFQLSGFRLELEDALRLPVDLVTTESSDREFLDRIAKESVVLYGKQG
ncbi:MAG: nucleotidyltransferase domain-containing protein [Clostridia bacterium]|jgi:predicted nucleotidyltransferase|nr:nucleotidyltransferase domain-containing protein [Clostridia bacterium]MBQ3957083.1 nucleotidyltransferase domain-containing protein [Clostridia bacterium]